MKKLIEKMEEFLEENKFEKIILDKEEIKVIVEYYNRKGE